ncbi:MAG: S41 family peptidase, partial [Candidatus Aminicenantes bacterium]|nr:S41 family peptidase [Candidatus Aminicenantes bacterium]
MTDLKKAVAIFIAILFILFFSLSAFPSSVQDKEEAAKPPALDAKLKAEVVKGVGDILKNLYIFPEKAKEMDALIAKKLQEGEYDKIEDVQAFARVLTDDLRSVSKDRHIRVIYGPEIVKRIRARQSQSAEEREKERQRAVREDRKRNFGFEKIELLDGNIGYLDLRGFSGFREAAETGIAAMNFLANADAVIIDLRRNGGGSPAMIQLISSYFLKESTHLNSFENRGQDEMAQFWSFHYVPGTPLFDTDLYILTSQRTFSAAEEFTYNMKNLKRATIVGETTGGGAHPGGTKIVNDSFLVWVPTGRAVNPITKTNWEGTGIAPDVAVERDKALEKARIIALEKMMKAATDEEAKASLQWALNDLKAKAEPAKVDESVLKKYVGHYTEGEILLENGQLYVLARGSKIKLIPLS